MCRHGAVPIAKTVKHFGVAVLKDRHIYPYYEDNNPTPTGCKIRRDGKVFTVEGDINRGMLFGQHAFGSGGKYIVVTEGETDAMAAYQLSGGFPAVSVRSAQSALKDCQAAYEWLDSFGTVVIAIDNDKPGQKAAQEVAELFGGKAKVMKMPPGCKDPVDIARMDKGEEVWKRCFWDAEQYTPDGIIAGSDMWELVNKPVEKADVLYPWAGLNAMTYGIRQAELVTITAGSGLGKSQMIRELVWYILQNVEDNIGLLFLEEAARKTGLALMSLAANKPLHLPTTESTESERQAAFKETLGTKRLFLFDHFGSTSVDNIVARVRYMAKALGCRYIFLDHVSIVVSAQSNGDERRALDEIMTKLRMMVQETGIALFVVSHLKRPDGKGHEEGAATSLSQLRGSGSIAQLSDMVLGLERDGQHEDAVTRNTTHVRVLKNRFSGDTGRACDLLYSKDTGRMEEYSATEEVL